MTLDCKPLRGGGYKPMLERAVYWRDRKEKTEGKAKACILIVDADRAEKGDDGWTLEQLKREAEAEKINLCIQFPKHQGLLLRLFPGKENVKPSAQQVDKLLRKEWPDYHKPATAYDLIKKFKLEDLLRVAKVDANLKNLLTIIGLIK